MLFLSQVYASPISRVCLMASSLHIGHGLVSVLRLASCPAAVTGVLQLPFSRWLPADYIITVTRSHNRGWRPQARGPRGSIEIAKCAIFRTNCATLNVTNPCGPGSANLCGCRVEFQEMGGRFATLPECALNFPSASYFDACTVEKSAKIFYQTLLYLLCIVG